MSDFTTIANWSGQAGVPLSAPPPLTTPPFVDMGAPTLNQNMEISSDAGFAVTGSPSLMILDLWRIVDGVRQRVASRTIPASEFSQPLVWATNFYARYVAVTPRFIDGTAPTVTAIVYARPMMQNLAGG